MRTDCIGNAKKLAFAKIDEGAEYPQLWNG